MAKDTTRLSTAQPGIVPNADVIPQVMRDAKHWLLHDRRKVPYYVSGNLRTGKLNSPRDLARLATFAEAMAALDGSDRFVGLGFALGEGWQGIDLDHVRDAKTGAIDADVADLIERADTYAEISPSGEGVHIIGFDLEAAPLLPNNTKRVEFYSGLRYFTVTGNAINGVRLVRRFSAEVIDIVTRLLLTPGEQATRKTQKPVTTPIKKGVPSAEWPGFKAELAKKLHYVPAGRGHTRWRNIGMGIALVCGGSMEGFEIWHGWSAANHKGEIGHDGKPVYKGQEFCLGQWRSFQRTEGVLVTWGTVQHYLDEFYPKPAPPPSPHKLPLRFMVGDLKRMNIPATEWVIQGLIAPGLTLLAAPPKEGKSYLALQWCLCVAAGVHTHGYATRQMRVSYFDLEEWHALLEERVIAISKGHGLPDELPLSIILETGVGEKALEDIAAEIEAGSKLIVVDILAKVRDEMNEDAKKNAYARDIAVIGRLATFALSYYDRGVAIVVVHHANKGQHDDWKKKISGSTGITGAVHTVMYLERPDLRGKDEEDKRAALNYRVLHATGKLVRDQEMTLEKMDDMGGWQSSAVRPWEIAATTKRKKIIVLLGHYKGAWVTAKDIANALGMTHNNCRQLLYQMGLTGMIESDGQGGLGYRLRPSKGG